MEGDRDVQLASTATGRNTAATTAAVNSRIVLLHSTVLPHPVALSKHRFSSTWEITRYGWRTRWTR